MLIELISYFFQAAYVLPILNNLLSQSSELVFDENHCEPHVIIMAPTRELVVQIYECIWKFGKGTNIRNGLLYGGTSIGYQKSKLLQVRNYISVM